MLNIVIPPSEMFNEETQEFISIKEQSLQLEHSLVSISKWESKWCKPFLDKKEKSLEETIDYVRCMTITQNVNSLTYYGLSDDNIKEIDAYIQAPMTATTFSLFGGNTANNEIVTSELIYYWMVSLNIPMECQKWHLNRLLTLIRVCNVKNSPPKKMSSRQVMSQYAALNAARRKKFNTKG